MASIITNEVYGKDYIADSAGLYAEKGKPICYDSRVILLKSGYSQDVLNAHSSKHITDEMVMDADLVVGVTEGIKNTLIGMYKEYESKITSFSEDIVSPCEGNAIAFEECFYKLCNQIEKLLYPDGYSRWKSKSEE